MTITPVEYVEDRLGAHKVWEDSQTVTEQLHQAMRTRDALNAGVKKLQLELEDREIELTDIVTKGYADLVKQPSQAQIDRDVRSTFDNDDQHRSMRQAIATQRMNLDAAETEVRALEFKGRSLTARMHELASILKFYTACKDAQTQARSMSVSNPAVSWPF